MAKHVGMKMQDVDLKLHRIISKRYDTLGLDVTPVQSGIIIYIYENGNGVCQKDLEEFMCRNKSTLSSILDTMEKKGYIQRVESDKDSRKKMLSLTDKSYKIMEILNQDREFIEEILCTGLSDDEYNTFCIVLDKINKNLERI